MSTKVDIRPIESVLLADVAVALSEAFREDGDNPAGEWEALLDREVSDGRLDTDTSVVAVMGERVIGACLVNRGPEGRGRIGPTGIVSDMRRQGVASLLVERARDGLMSSGVRHLTLEVGADNTGAQRLYESLGFQSVRPLVNLVIRRSSLGWKDPMPSVEPLGWEQALEASRLLHPTAPAFQRHSFYVASFHQGAIACGVSEGGGGWRGVALVRGRAVLDVVANPPDPSVLAALLWNITERLWTARIIHEPANEEVAKLLESIGCEVESSALEMAWQRTAE
jgi:ribosomal protein S18 acetylase RimI-like enzyme